MLKLYHGTTSVCAAKVRLVLYEKGLPFESGLLNLQAGDQHDPEYLKLNPKAVVEWMTEDDHDRFVVPRCDIEGKLWEVLAV